MAYCHYKCMNRFKKIILFRVLHSYRSMHKGRSTHLMAVHVIELSWWYWRITQDSVHEIGWKYCQQPKGNCWNEGQIDNRWKYKCWRCCWESKHSYSVVGKQEVTIWGERWEKKRKKIKKIPPGEGGGAYRKQPWEGQILGVSSDRDQRVISTIR